MKEYLHRDVPVDYCPNKHKGDNKCSVCDKTFANNRLRIRFTIAGLGKSLFMHPQCLADQQVYPKSAEK